MKIKKENLQVNSLKIEDLLCLGNQVLHKDQNKLLLASIIDKNPLELNLHLNDLVSEDHVLKYKECLESIKKGEPLQYALGKTNFYGFDFYVDKRVLIPRFETEELVYNAKIYIDKYFHENVKILDLCSGSGCIGLTLKKLNNNFDLTLSDVSHDAIDVININSKKLEVDVKIIESDLFQNISSKFDVIISNPPYVSDSDEVSDIVLKNEPHLALYAKNDGLEFYERILKSCENYLNDKYLIAFEIGSSQKDKIISLINKYLKNVKIIAKKDMQERDRMIFIFKNIDLVE